MAMDLQLTGKTALVTGASRGIGWGCALALSMEGVRVAVMARRRPLLDELADEIEAAGGIRPAVIEADLTVPGAASRVGAEAEQALGQVDILVNSAGRSQNPDNLGVSGFDLTDEDWDREMLLNYGSIRQLSLALVPAMMDRRYGRIINITGKAEPVRMGTANPPKAAVHAWAKGFAREVAPYGVTVNSIPPGKIVSEQILRNYSEQERREMTEWIPVGEFGDPSDMGNLVVFLASPLARYITGTVIPMDGGYRRFAY